MTVKTTRATLLCATLAAVALALVACSESGSALAVETPSIPLGLLAAPMPPPVAGAALVLSAHGSSDRIAERAICRIAFQVHNRSPGTVTQFATELIATHSATGAPLQTISLAGIGIAGGKLAAGETSKPWPLSVRDTRCEDVAVAFGPIRCGLDEKPCGPVAATQTNLARITPPRA